MDTSSPGDIPRPEHQERNGIYFYDRSEKFDMERIRRIFSIEP